MKAEVLKGSVKVDTGFTQIKVDQITPLTSRMFVGNYCITYNKETNKLRVFDTNIKDDTRLAELFNSEKE